MTGSKLYKRLTARRDPLTEDELLEPAMAVELWEALIRDVATARNLAAYLEERPQLLDLEVAAFVRSIQAVPGVDRGTAGRIAAVLALHGQLKRLAAETRNPQPEPPEGAPGGENGGGGGPPQGATAT